MLQSQSLMEFKTLLKTHKTLRFMLYTIFGVLSIGLIGLELFLREEWLDNQVSLAMTEVILKCINLIFEI